MIIQNRITVQDNGTARFGGLHQSLVRSSADNLRVENFIEFAFPLQICDQPVADFILTQARQLFVHLVDSQCPTVGVADIYAVMQAV